MTSTEAKKRSSDKINKHDSKKQKMTEKVVSSDSEVEAEERVEEPVEERVEEPEEEQYDGDKQDETLTCRDCESEFIFSVGEQEFFESKGFDNKPSRCSDCKAAKKASRDGGGQRERGAGVCYAFQKGQCDRGDSCRFSHSSGGDSGSGDRGFGGRPKGACYSYQKGNCRYGDSCRFSHTEGGAREDDGYRGGRSSGGRGGGVCYSFQKGNCNYGDSCRFSH